VVLGDMRVLPFARRFDAVLSFFTSFGYFASESENERVIAEVARVLEPGGLFVLDLMDRRSVVEGLRAETVREAEGRTIRERRWISGDGQRVEKEVVVGDSRGAVQRFHESVRLYEQDEVESVLSAHGFQLAEALGDFRDIPHEPGTSPRMILAAVRGGR
jgi:SAM-dependent methyltransferase